MTDDLGSASQSSPSVDYSARWGGNSSHLQAATLPLLRDRAIVCSCTCRHDKQVKLICGNSSLSG